MTTRRTLTLILVALIALSAAACSTSTAGTNYRAFRASYLNRATYGQPYGEQPPSLTDAQIDLAVHHVCVEGMVDPDRADQVGAQLADRDWDNAFGPSDLGSAIYDAVSKIGCPVIHG